jgi:hypothetical protein
MHSFPLIFYSLYTRMSVTAKNYDMIQIQDTAHLKSGVQEEDDCLLPEEDL